MIDKLVCSLLIPIEFDRNVWNQIEDTSSAYLKSYIENIKINKQYGSKAWFEYCFRPIPVKETFQLGGSPLISKADGGLVKRIELTQPVRSLLGIPKDENRICKLLRDKIAFRIGKIRLLLFSFGKGIVYIETMSEDLEIEQVLNLSEQLAAVQKDAEFSYENKVAKDEIEEIAFSMKKVIKNLLSLQTYIPLRSYKKENFSKAHVQLYLTGNISDDNDKLIFFEMLRNQRRSNMKAKYGVDSLYLYEPFEYISWIVGDKTLICYGDMSMCGNDNREFIDGPGGLVKSISLNYITIFSYLIAVQLLIQDTEISRDKKNAILLS